MANILFLGTGTQAFAILKNLHKAGNKIYILTSEKGNYADHSRYADTVIYYSAEDAFIPLLKETIVGNSIDVVIPMGDGSAEFLSKNKDDFAEIVNFKMPDYENFLKGYDKNKLMTLCREKGYPHPVTIDLSLVDYKDKIAFDDFPFPGFLKPNCTTGGRGMRIINNYEELVNIFPVIKKEFGECHLQRFIKAGGRQVKVQLYVNEKGELLNHSVLNKVRWYPVKGGSSCCSVTMEDEKIVQICYNILKDINWVGFADFDTIEDPDTNELLIMEINPRLPACIGAAVEAGVNWGQVIVDDYLGREQKKYEYRLGVAIRHIGFDVLWFLKSDKRWKTQPSWFKFFGPNVIYQDFHFCDQKPFWIGTYHNIMKLFDPNFKKAKFAKITPQYSDIEANGGGN